MDTVDAVYRNAALFVRTQSEEEAQALRTMCAAAADGLRARLRPGLTAEDCPGFDLAAAWMAIGFFSTGRRADGVRSFTVGDLRFDCGAENAAAEALVTQAELLLASKLRDSVAVMGVRG